MKDTNCTHTPTITSRGQRSAAVASGSARVTLLYDDAQTRREHRQSLEEKHFQSRCTFKPTITSRGVRARSCSRARPGESPTDARSAPPPLCRSGDEQRTAMDALAQLSEQVEMRGCTFAPKVACRDDECVLMSSSSASSPHARVGA